MAILTATNTLIRMLLDPVTGATRVVFSTIVTDDQQNEIARSPEVATQITVGDDATAAQLGVGQYTNLLWTPAIRQAAQILKP